MSGPIRVMVVDDHPMWRDAVARDLTEAGYDVVATATDGAQALRVAGATRPDVVVLDLQLPDMSGVEVTRGLQAVCPAAHVLVLSASGEQQDVLDAVKAGAVGYLLKSAARPEFLDAVRRTASGDAVFTPGLAALVLGEFRRLSDAPAGGSGPGVPRLSERETEILRMVATGLSYKQIATRLVLSHRTVQNHVQNTLGKLQLHNRVELVRYAIEHGLAGEFESRDGLPPGPAAPDMRSPPWLRWPKRKERAMSGIVVGIDGSPNSERALEWAMRQAAAVRAPLTVITVHEVPKSYWGGIPVVGPGDEPLLESLRQAAEEMTRKVAGRLGDAGPAPVTVHAVSGFVVKELVDASRDADLVVLGARGASGFTRLIMGSVSQEVVQHSACPVVIVPHKG